MKLKYVAGFALIALLTFAQCTSDSKEKASKPNLVIILTDDQGYGDIGYNGNSQIETPIIDSLANVTFRFDNFYVSPVCAPTRASLLTGRYHYRTGTFWVTHGKENMNPEEYTLAELFRDNGYTTGAFGKWHNGVHYPFHPNQQGFETFVGFCMGHYNNYFNTTIEENGQTIKAEGYLPDYLTDRAIRFIEENRDQPFFCYIPYNTPHGPFQVPDKYFDKYKAKGLDDKAACVYGMCENIDDNVGRVWKTLQQLTLLDNTIVIYFSDNGPVPGRYNAGLRGTKGHIHEGGVRVPSLFYIPPGVLQTESNQRVITDVAAHIDIMPTLIDLLGLNSPHEIDFDGISLVKLLREGSDELVDNRIFFNKAPQKDPVEWGGAVRTSNHRLALRNQDTLLFNITNDPCETLNLIDSLPELANQLSEIYFTWIRETLDEMQSFTAIPVGVEGQHSVHMPAHESIPSGNASFKGGMGWANDWLTNLQEENDSVYWLIQPENTLRCQAKILYNAGPGTVGMNLEVSTNSQSKLITLNAPFVGEVIPSPDRFPRKEIYEKTWGELDFGELEIDVSDDFISIKPSQQNTMTHNDLEIKGLKLIDF